MTSPPFPKMSDIRPYLPGEVLMDLDFIMGNLEREDRTIDWSSPWDTAYLVSSKKKLYLRDQVLRVAREFRMRQEEYA